MHFGIDLGTTNSLIACWDQGQVRLIGQPPLLPSVVSHLDGSLLVGQAAKDRLVSHPDQTVAAFKRAMGTTKRFSLGPHRLTAPELSALILRDLADLAQAETGTRPRDVVISVPAYFNQVQRKAVREAALAADLTPLRLVNEPTAAALAFGLAEIETEGHILVFDLGGGTFDVSIVEVFEKVIEVRASSGDAFLGGEDFTAALADHLQAAHGLSRDTGQRAVTWAAAESLKHQLSRAPEAEIAGQGWRVTRDDFAALVAPLLQRLRLPVERALHDARLSPRDIGRVVLVGGATRMPVVRALVARLFGRLPEAGVDPDQAVALGAATQAALIARDQALDDVVMTDVTAFSLGFDVARSLNGRHFPGYFQPVIERNTTVPVSREEVFSALQPGQKQLVMKLFQGEAPMVKDNIELGEVRVDLPTRGPDCELVALRLSYDTSGLIEIDSHVLSTGARETVVVTALTGGLSEAEIAVRRASLAALKVHPMDETVNLALIARLERCYAMAREAERVGLQDLLAAFHDLLQRQNLGDIARKRDEITAELDRFEAHYVR
ncbi:Hsp70 family protein [Stagnihabitans tardus]|uniref:Hsp70 family protein n=1 Tax=Stagnihabitans tardus TaxID=2699202 RepID=A0AAE4YFV2_9RHOB|nr:Hsp70 family protein [Stagnihabitans tardus]NBZ89155.1 Hsp70 family protein [Stagnihabitans tardus]